MRRLDDQTADDLAEERAAYRRGDDLSDRALDRLALDRADAEQEGRAAR